VTSADVLQKSNKQNLLQIQVKNFESSQQPAVAWTKHEPENVFHAKSCHKCQARL